MSLGLLGMGTAVPPYAMGQEDAARLAGALSASTRVSLLTALYRRAGVRQRHSVLLQSPVGADDERQSFYRTGVTEDDRGPTTAKRMMQFEEHATGLAAVACRRALADAGTDPAAISHLVTISCSGFSAPGFDLGLAAELPLRPGVARTHLGFMGCHGALNGLRVASAFAAAQPDARILVCAMELCTLHLQYTSDAQQMVANALFADGAAAVVAGAASADDAGWRLVDQASVVLPETADLMAWHIRDHGFEMQLSPRVPDVIREHLRPWLTAWLRRHGLDLSQIRSWAVHPGGPRILTATADAAGFDRAMLGPSEHVLANYGNMSSPTLLFIVQHLRHCHEPRPAVLLAFGPGLTIEAGLIR